MRSLPVALVAVALSAVSLAAQELQPQQRVRLVLTRNTRVEGYGPPQELKGTLLAADPDSLTLQVIPGATPIRISRGVIRRAYVSRGVPSRAASAGGGAVLGALVWGVSAWAWKDDEERSTRDVILTRAAIGAGVGLVTGALFPRERWRRVHLPAQARVSLVPAPGSVALAFGVALAR